MMFTDGLRTRREVGNAQRRDAFNSTSTRESIVDPIIAQINGAYKVEGIPPTKFQSGNLSGVNSMPQATTILVSGKDGRSGSDMDTSSDSEDEIYGNQYSFKLSPQDELSDSATSTEISFARRRMTHSAPQRETHISDAYSSSISLQTNIETRVEQDLRDRKMRSNRLGCKDTPSAPLFGGSDPEIEPVANRILTSQTYGPHYSVDRNSFATTCKKEVSNIHVGTNEKDRSGSKVSNSSVRTADGMDVNLSAASLPARLPTSHTSRQGPWCAVISYDACVRLCLHSWAKGCAEEAPYFLNNECMVLRNAFGLQHVLLQPEEELLANQTSEFFSEGVSMKPNKVYGKMKVQVRRVKMGLEPPPGCTFSSLKPHVKKLESLHRRLLILNSMLHSGWKAAKKVRITPQVPATESFSQQSLAYMNASAEYVKELSRLLKAGLSNLHNRSSSYEEVKETYNCLLRLKSSSEEDVVRMQPGDSEAHMFFPDGHGDDLIIEVQDSKGKCYGRIMVQVSSIANDPGDKLRWWPIYRDPDHEPIGRTQLYICYTACVDKNKQPKCGSVAETVAYDFVLEVAMKLAHFQRRKLLLHGPWKWLVTEFASYYGVSDAYTKLRYLSYVMDVATPTKDCLDVVNDLLLPVLMKANSKNVLSHQESRILGEVEDQIQQILALVFENYKSLDELALSGMTDVFRPANGLEAPVLAPAVNLYSLLHDIFNPEAQLKFCKYFQAATKKRSRRHLTETDEFIQSMNESAMDPVTFSTCYQKMRSLVSSIRNEIFTDIEIQNLHVLPSFIDLPNLTASIYSVELCDRLHKFLVSCPPPGPSPPVSQLVISTADLEREITCWNINIIKGGIDAKELFHMHITRWIHAKRLALLESCKHDKVKWSGVAKQLWSIPFVDDMYDQLRETLNEYDIIICRWPEYAIVLERAIADVEKAIVEAMDKQYADVLSTLNLGPKIPGLKYVQKFAKRTVNTYYVPDELAILLNSMKRLIDIQRPKIEAVLNSWCSSIREGGNSEAGECLGEITVMLRAKFRSYVQALVEKLFENTCIQGSTKLKKIIQEFKESVVESDVRNKMQPLRDLLINTINHLHTLFETQLFIAICRGFWDRMGQEMLKFLENKGENKLWYKGSRITLSILDETFASEMQQLLGNALQDKDAEPPRSIMEARSVLCKDAVNYNKGNYLY